MPTLPSQGDIIQAAHGSHGDYTAIVLYPASVAECYRYTIEAFNAAEESRSPVVLLLAPGEVMSGPAARWREMAGAGAEIVSLADGYLGYVDSADRVTAQEAHPERSYYGPELAPALGIGAFADKTLVVWTGDERGAVPRKSCDARSPIV